MNRPSCLRRLERLLGVLALLLCLAGTAEAAASYCTATYTIASSNQIGFYNYATNSVVGVFTAVSTGNTANALAQSQANGNLYYIDRTNNNFHKIDVNTGTDTNVGALNPLPTAAGNTVVVVGGTTDASGNYYIYLNNGTFGQVNLGTGAIVGGAYTSFTVPTGYALNTSTNGDFAIDSSGQTYVVAQASTVPTGLTVGTFLWKLNLTTGALTSPVPFRTNATTQWGTNQTANGLSIDPTNGTFLISTGTGDGTNGAGVYVIDPSTGITTFKVGSTVLTDLGTCPILPNPPTVSKSFSPTSAVGTSGTTTLTLTLSNSDLTPVFLQSVFTDTLPTNMVVANPNNLSTTCSATPTAAAGSSTVTLPSGTKLLANSSCTITVSVTATGVGTYTNTVAAGVLDTTAGKNTTAATATYTLQAQPTLTLNKTIAAPGRVNTADQFTVQILNGATVTASGSTTGTGTTATTGSTTLAAGTTYTLNELMASGSVSPLSGYTTAISCSNTNTGSSTTLPSGSGQSFSVTPNGNDVISCTLTNTAKPASIAVTKTAAAPTQVTAPNGYQIVYTLTAQNSGGQAGTYALTDTPGLDSDVTITSASYTKNGGAATALTGSGPYTLAASGTSLAQQTTDTYLLTVNFTVNPSGSTSNDACTGSSGNGLFNTGSLTFSGTTTTATACQATPKVPDFTDTKAASTTLALVGTPFNYTIQVANVGGGAGTPSVSDSLDTTKFTINSVTAASGYTCTQSGTATVTVSCTRSAAMAAGTANELAVTINVTPLAAAMPGPLTNQATVTGDGQTPNCSSNLNCSATSTPLNQAPVANNDTSSTPANTAKTFSITGNDTDTSPGTVNATTTLFSTSGQPSGSTLSNGNRTISVPGEGSYTLDNSGNVTFTPVSGYSGTTTPVKYTVQDNQGATSNVASITVTVTPVAVNDTASTAPSTLVNIPVLNNDLGSGKVATSLLFPTGGQPTGSTVSNGGKTLTDADGTYTIKTDGTVDFTPALGKTGTLSPVSYTFQDGAGQTSSAATITVTVSAITPPTATSDSASTPKNTAVTLSGSTNDTAGSLAIDNTSVTFPTSGQPGTATVSNGGKTLAVTGQGTYQVQTNGTVIFTPVSTFAGTATPVYYTVKDTAGNGSNAATLNVTVTNQPPVANNVTNALLTSTAPATALSPGVSGSDPDGNVVTYTVTTLPTAAMGTLYCNGTAISSAPSACAPAQLSFKPNPSFNGNATFQYTVTDDNGATSNVATYTIPVNKPPVANNDSGATNPNVSVTFSVTGNDTDTSPGTVDVTTTAFDASSTGTISGGGKTLTISGEGVYTLDNSGNVTFAPAAGFNNGTSTAKYTVKDNQGAVSNVATITVNVPASVDLAITKTGPAYFKPGDTLSYTLTVTNSGSAATGVKVTDTLPSGLTFASASSGGSYDSGTGKVTWTIGNVANGSTTTLTLTGTAPGSASVEANSGPTSLANTASVAGNETEVVTSNNSATSTAQLVYPKLSKRVRNVTQNGAFGTVGSGKPGEVLEYCIDFKNYGVSVAGFVISDTVPSNTNASLSGYGAGLGLQVLRNSATTTRTSTGGDSDGGSLSASALSLDLGTLAAGESGNVCFQASIK